MVFGIEFKMFLIDDHGSTSTDFLTVFKIAHFFHANSDSISIFDLLWSFQRDRITHPGRTRWNFKGEKWEQKNLHSTFSILTFCFILKSYYTNDDVKICFPNFHGFVISKVATAVVQPTFFRKRWLQKKNDLFKRCVHQLVCKKHSAIVYLFKW